MLLCYLDASAWSKRYSSEHGCDMVDFLFDDVLVRGLAQLASSALSYAEVFSMLVRFRNRTSVTDQDFGLVLRRIAEDEGRILWLSTPEGAFRSCTELILKHNLNATDAALLDVLLSIRNQFRETSHEVWLVSSDKRFLRAAVREGLSCLDPEVISLREIRDLFGR